MNNLVETSNESKAMRNSNIENSLFSEKHFMHYMVVAETLAKSSLVPKNMYGKPADIIIAMEMGNSLGIPYMQALQDIAVINGRPVLYGDGLLAVVQGHHDYEWIDEQVTSELATCTIKRRNHEPRRVTFSKEDAKKAGLWGKSGPWLQYPERMLKMRARGFCIRDVFADALRGIKTEEEVSDYPQEKKTKANAADALNDLLSKKKNNQQERGTIVLSSTEQHEEIKRLIDEKRFTDDRLSKAFEYYNVSELHELDYGQADNFIKRLNKEVTPTQ